MITPDENKCLRDQLGVSTNACDSAAKQYEDYYKGFAALDTKSQSTATISGLVLAAVAAFVKDGRIPVLVSARHWWILLIVAPPVTALFSVIFALTGAKVTEVVVPFDAAEQIREAKDLAELDCEEFSLAHVLNYYNSRLDHWNNALASIESCVIDKAKWVLNAQITMIASLALLLALYVIVLLKS
ncbi:hypothetical protein [Edaphobacter modestus]|uniref:Uncharacterized protein n=1 Tax=Edaphobacter modestus TaxID=388466 RepID=A0A4Q7YS48_9BACT|nr:hypothetical protein [Edaphobacter modestus]RZU40348.1 hypothetical protein BDD14_1799 [Edaphobacter modestus]